MVALQLPVLEPSIQIPNVTLYINYNGMKGLT